MTQRNQPLTCSQSSSALRRLASDHAALHKQELPPNYVHPPSSSSTPDDLTQLTVMLAGPPGTPFSEGLWKLHLKMPLDYPKNPPKAAFKTKIYHPNVEEATGSVCLDTLKRDWQPKLTLRDILVTISCLLINPNPDSALNSEAGKLLQEDFDSFARKARLMTSIHARIPPNLRAEVNRAKTRGEEKPKQEIVIFESDAQSDAEDEASASKENDPSISPSPVSPPPSLPLRRNTVLGKRPLSDLPTPEEPPSDDEEQHACLSASEKNIIANTPNLSKDMSSLSFTNLPPATASSLKTPNSASFPPAAFANSPHRPTVSNARTANHSSTFSSCAFTFTGISTVSTSDYSSNDSTEPPPAKRTCSGDGKENFTEGLENGALGITHKHAPSLLQEKSRQAPLIGLGVKIASTAPAAKKLNTTGAKNKPRTGLRRL